MIKPLTNEAHKTECLIIRHNRQIIGQMGKGEGLNKEKEKPYVGSRIKTNFVPLHSLAKE